MKILFKEIQEQDLPEIKKIYDWYIANSTATFHTEPIQIDQLREFIYIDHPLYKSYLIWCNSDIAGYCFLTNYKKRQA
jgi:L-amino acid N-acyltransferase YncA